MQDPRLVLNVLYIEKQSFQQGSLTLQEQFWLVLAPWSKSWSRRDGEGFRYYQCIELALIMNIRLISDLPMCWSDS